MRRHNVDGPLFLLTCATLLLALAPSPALALDARSLDSAGAQARYDLELTKFRFAKAKRPHWSHRAPGTKRQNAAQGLLCALGVTAACEGSAGPAINTATDPFNCGAIGNVCPSSFPNSASPVTCQAGHCLTSCVPGFSFDLTSSSCIQTATDALNCGAVGRVCTKATGTSAVTCVAGVCLATDCARGYTLAGGSCAVVPFAADVRNCGAAGVVCPASYANGQGSTCDDGQCRPESCDNGYAWNGAAGECLRDGSDADGCSCAEGQTCFAGVCLARSSSPTLEEPSPQVERASPPALAFPSSSEVSDSIVPDRPFLPSETADDEAGDAVPPDAVLVLAAPLHERAKRGLLCPDGLTACPIAGSASLRDASSAPSRGDPRSVAELLRAFADEVARSRGGYECIDAGSEGSSCGGCATLGEGRDCERDVEHATAAGCGEGR